MGRSQFVRNLEEICNNKSVANVGDLKKGADEDITFKYTGNNESIPCTILFPELDEYPSGYPVFIYSDSESIPKSIVDSLSQITYADVPLKQLLEKVVKVIGSRTPSPKVDEDGDEEMADFDSEDEEVGESEDDFNDNDDESDAGWGDDDLFENNAKLAGEKFIPTIPAPKFAPAKVKHDLLDVKKAGFRVSVYGTPDVGHFTVCCSIKISKLGLSEEAINAWEVDGSNYLVLLIRYTDAYRDTASLLGVRHAVSFRVGTSTRFKPLAADIAGIFTSNIETVKEGITSFKNFFLSHSLNRLMESFMQLLQYRVEKGYSWDEAENNYEEILKHEQSFAADFVASPKGVPVTSENMPSIVRSDALAGIKVYETRKTVSMPLLAMQYVVRRFVHCTKFCTVCHKRIHAEFSALLPYVCSNDLCLFQHINIAHDDIVERNLLTRSSVVDLLLSFCYASVISGNLTDYPRGLNIHIPDAVGFQANYRWEQNEVNVAFPFSFTPGQLKVGSWVTIQTSIPATGTSQPLPFTVHATIKDTSYFPLVALSKPFYTGSNVLVTSGRAGPNNTQDAHMFALSHVKLPGELQGTFHICNTLFDEVDELRARNALGQLMRTMPSINDMIDRVESGKSLSQWPERMLPQAYKLLRWIIASNRSHLVPVKEDEQVKEEVEVATGGLTTTYHQFKWAMGSPDKEEALSKSIITECGKNSQYPTIFAYHGSPLGNWHSIIREGLHFKSVLNGRAYGNGIYHALDLNTSLSYCGTHVAYANHVSTYPGWEPPKDVAIWPGSNLRVTSAISLNEIVNSPDKFQSKSPYLVVQHVEWVQTRYLFVAGATKTAAVQLPAKKSPPSKRNSVPGFNKDNGVIKVALSQDPNYTPRSVSSKLRIPIAPYFDRNKLSSDGSTVFSSIVLISDSEDSDGEFTSFVKKLNPKIAAPTRPPPPPRKITPYDPKLTDRSRLQFLPPPATASSMTTKALSKELASIMALQHQSPLPELGWYIDGDAISNVYQWIVELHSFPLELPLAQDLLSASLQSVILEVRFGKTYPMSPPFVRVVSPRFLPFMQGGGGHVTAGGAICMELLTNSGWSAVSSIESVLLQVKMAIESTEPKPARLERGGERGMYGAQEAKEAYIRACRTHGWSVPKDIEDM